MPLKYSCNPKTNWIPTTIWHRPVESCSHII